MALELINIKAPFEVSFTGNPIQFVFAVTPYGDYERSRDTQLIVNVYVEDSAYSTVFKKIRSQVFFPSNDGLVEFDLRSYIEPFLSFTKVQPNLSTPIVCSSHITRCKISYQLLQNNAVVTDIVTSSAFVAIKGGLPYEQWHPSEFFSNVINIQRKSINYEVEGELVGKDDTRFLYWLYPIDDEEEQHVNVVVDFSDGTTNSQTLDTTILTDKWGVCCVPVGYNRMNLDSLIIDDKDIVSYTFAVINSDDVIITSKSYILDYRNFNRTEQALKEQNS